MFQNTLDLYGKQLSASDGIIGSVKDFYFDDETWSLRYMVADIGTWLPGRKVLLPPDAFGHGGFRRSDEDSEVLRVSLTRQQIEDSPSIETHATVSRQYEKEYYQYYGWPGYWQDGGMWGATMMPMVMMPPVDPNLPVRQDDVHLRSTKEVTGYHIHAADGVIGSVSGFMVDGVNWKIHELAVESGHWYAGKTIFLLPADIIRISYDDSSVFVNLTMEAIRETAKNHVVQG